MLDATVLKNEIVNDSTKLGYKNPDGSWQNDATICALINTQQAVQVGTAPLSPVTVLAALASTTVAAIQDAADSPASAPVPNAAGRASAKRALLLLSTGQSLDVVGPAGQELLTELQTASLLTTTDEANLQAAAKVIGQQSRAQQLWGPAVVIAQSDVDRARNA
ncbi:MAG: hypothetical protein ACYCW6_00065 [Candidatus Xenobia bacterium]